MMRRQGAGVSAAGCAALLALAGVASGQLDPPAPGSAEKAEHVKIRALADVEQITPGASFHIVVVFDIDPGWHIYWKNPGEGAAPPEIELSAPPGFQIGEVRFPRPLVHRTVLGDEYVHERQAAMFVPVKAPASLQEGDIAFSANVNWAVCDDNRCLMGEARCQAKVKASAEDKPATPSSDPVIAAHRKRLPLPLAEQKKSETKFDGATLTIVGPAHGEHSGSFIPHASPGVTYTSALVFFDDETCRIVAQVEIKPHNTLGKPVVLGGLVALGARLEDPSYEFSMPVRGP